MCVPVAITNSELMTNGS